MKKRKRLIIALLAGFAAANAMENQAQKDELFCAVDRGDVKKCAQLIEADAGISRTSEAERALGCASLKGYTEIVRLLVNAGTNVNGDRYSGNTALIWAAIQGNKPIVQLLIEAGAHMHRVDDKGQTALANAANLDRLETSELLVQKMLTDNKRFYTFMLCLKQKNAQFPRLYCNDLRKLIGRLAHAIVKEENVSRTRIEVDQIRDAKIKSILVKMLEK